ncbi:MAG TPA: aminotransferase class V-fold PLP-dependent enzyme [Fibrobacteria bacterium]|nr:aminotransferase class V-fold PLP-dependent enzyme [Fibrobacteria bacterium]
MRDAEDSIYLDHNATTAIAAECLRAMQTALSLGPLNPSSKHALGDRAKKLAAEARAQVAGFLGASPPNVVVTSGGTESNHLAILGALAMRPERKGIVTSEVEHPATLMLMRHLEAQGRRVTYLPVDEEGLLDPDLIADVVTEDTALVSLMWANNETGVLFPVERAAEIAKSHGALFHTDAVQAVGKTPVNYKSSGVDFLSLSGHKLYAPSGIGALIVPKAARFTPMLFGHQERGRRGGTENIAGLVALGTACALLADQPAYDMAKLKGLRDRLENGLLALFPFAQVNGARDRRVVNTSNIRFGNRDAEVLLGRLDALGIYASAGAACSSSGRKPSHVLTAMGLSEEAALASIRFSLGRHNVESQIDALLRAMPQVVGEVMTLASR